ncbi:hypothetical protein WR25_20894 [Diploscapter pachys]|uniref:Uncharacterized protein n=1 Tax=Diploscapter pachys TaxID=2018661 RepID=A0A2A2L030_9BILA|nr:hypothetical protein WR25_20894 [Diploscapter pachys]
MSDRGEFKRYVWVNGERRRRRNRENYEAKKRRLESVRRIPVRKNQGSTQERIDDGSGRMNELEQTDPTYLSDQNDFKRKRVEDPSDTDDLLDQSMRDTRSRRARRNSEDDVEEEPDWEWDYQRRNPDVFPDELLPKARRGVKFKNDTGRSLFLVGTFQIDETRDD